MDNKLSIEYGLFTILFTSQALKLTSLSLPPEHCTQRKTPNLSASIEEKIQQRKMGEDENKDHHHPHHHHESQSDQQPPPQYGTFQGVANYPPPLPPRPPQQPGVGFPRPVPPPGATDFGPPPPNPQYYAHGYQTVPGTLKSFDLSFL